MRSSLLSGLSAETLASAMQAWKRGDLRQLFSFWEDMAERDDVITTVKSKREKRLARRSWQVIADPMLSKGREAEVAEQKRILSRFWWNVSAVDAYDRNVRGGFALLVRQMMSAVSFRYAVHNIAWRFPEKPGQVIGAEFQFAPLHFFENQAGTLRFCPNGTEYAGKEITLVGEASGSDLGDWIVTAGEGLMMAGGISYFAKRNAFSDWLILSERIGMRPTMGRTRAAQGSEAGEAMAQAVQDIHNDMCAVIYGDDGESKIEKLDMGTAADLPMRELVERLDRRLAALWLGADLSTFSSTQGQGSGASLQADEAVLLELDDAQMVEDTLDRVSQAVLRYHFGPEVEPLVYLKITVPAATDQKLLISAVEMLVKHGAKVGVRDVMERLAFSEAPEGEEVLTPPIDYNSSYAQSFAEGETAQTGLDAHNDHQRGQSGQQTTFNAAADEADFINECARLITRAAVRDRKPLADALRECLAADDAGLFERLSAFNAALPSAITEDAEQVKAWHSIIATAQLRGWTLGTPEE